MVRKGWVGLQFAIIAGLMPARADEWMPAKVETYSSQNGLLRLTVTPREIASPLAYFEDKVQDKTQSGQKPGGATAARGLLEHKGSDGRWATLWHKPLVNDVSPVTALVSNSGYVVTFDNWHAMGWGDEVVATYGQDGTLTRSLSLFDILPKEYVLGLPRSVSSIHWSGRHRIAEADNAVVLAVVIPSDTDDWNNRRYVDVRIDLASGKVLPDDSATWRKAMAEGVAAGQKVAASDDAWFAEFKAPLLGPKDGNWSHYLYEAFQRLDPDWQNRSLWLNDHIISAPDKPDYQRDKESLRDRLREPAPEEPIVLIASPEAEANLVTLLGDIAGTIKPGGLKGQRVYVAAAAQYGERLATIFRPTGATFIHLDPMKPIPQRPERIEEYRRDYEAAWHRKLP